MKRLHLVMLSAPLVMLSAPFVMLSAPFVMLSAPRVMLSLSKHSHQPYLPLPFDKLRVT